MLSTTPLWTPTPIPPVPLRCLRWAMRTQLTRTSMRALPRERTIVPCQAETSFPLRRRCRPPEVLLRRFCLLERRLRWLELAVSWLVDRGAAVDHIGHMISAETAYPAANPGQHRLFPG